MLAIYVVVEPHLPPHGTERGIWATFVHLGDSLSAAGIAAGSAGLAYVIGYTSELSVPPLLEVIQGWRDTGLRRGAFLRFLLDWVRSYRIRDPAENSVIYGMRGYSALLDVFRPRLTRLDAALRNAGTSLANAAIVYDAADWDDREKIDENDVPPALSPLTGLLQRIAHALKRSELDADATSQRTVVAALDPAIWELLNEVDIVRTRMLGDENELFSAIDRLRSEGEFRLVLIVPGLALATAFAYRGAWVLIALTLVLVIASFIQGLRRLEESYNMTFDALRVQRAHAPLVESIEGVIDVLKKTSAIADPVTKA
jgi:hypothetical protein